MMRRTLRDRLVKHIGKTIERRGYPRLQMMLLVALTGGAGFLCSFALLHSGLDEMWLRYLICVGAAYVVFLVLLWFWLRSTVEDFQPLDAIDAASDLADLLPEKGLQASQWQGAGGKFGGGGGSGRFQEATEGISEDVVETATPLEHAADAAGAADELAIPMFILVLVASLLAGILFVSFSIVYSAPALFAELLLDGVLATTLYRRLRKLETRHWLETAIRQTFKSFLLAALVLVFSGWLMALYAPEARSLGDVLARISGA
jgi:hypothetical protein